MTNSENIIEFGPNAYAKPATALNILRETVMGRELFDYAFKEYCRRWAYKHPSPADFFRTMEDASGVDLDWFWRAWFFDIEPVNVSLKKVVAYKAVSPEKMPVKMDTIKSEISWAKIDSKTGNNNALRRGLTKNQYDNYYHVSRLRNKAEGLKFAVDVDTTLRDFYYYYNEQKADSIKAMSMGSAINLPKIVNRYEDQELLTAEEFSKYATKYYYEITCENEGGAVTPVIVQWNFTDGSSEVDYINAYIWRKNESSFTKHFVKSKSVQSVIIDPFRETADIDESNNVWPRNENVLEETRFEIFKQKHSNTEEDSPMKRSKQNK